MDKPDQEGKSQQLEDLRTMVETYKRDYDNAQDENYKLVKKVNILKDDNDNKDTQIRRLNSKIAELKEELAKVKSARNKDKELIYHRKNEVLKLFKLVGSLLKSTSIFVAEYGAGCYAVLESLADAKTIDVSQTLTSKLQGITMSSKTQESLDAIVLMSKSYKENENIGDFIKPIDFKVGSNPQVQRTFDFLLAKLTATGSEAAAYSTPKHKLAQEEQQPVPKEFSIQAKEAPKENEDGRISNVSSPPHSMVLEMPETSSIEAEQEQKGEIEVLSAAKLMYRLRADTNHHFNFDGNSPTSQDAISPVIIASTIKSFIKSFNVSGITRDQNIELIKLTNTLQEKIRESIIIQTMKTQVIRQSTVKDTPPHISSIRRQHTGEIETDLSPVGESTPSISNLKQPITIQGGFAHKAKLRKNMMGTKSQRRMPLNQMIQTPQPGKRLLKSGPFGDNMQLQKTSSNQDSALVRQERLISIGKEIEQLEPVISERKNALEHLEIQTMKLEKVLFTKRQELVEATVKLNKKQAELVDMKAKEFESLIESQVNKRMLDTLEAGISAAQEKNRSLEKSITSDVESKIKQGLELIESKEQHREELKLASKLSEQFIKLVLDPELNIRSTEDLQSYLVRPEKVIENFFENNEDAIIRLFGRSIPMEQSIGDDSPDRPDTGRGALPVFDSSSNLLEKPTFNMISSECVSPFSGLAQSPIMRRAGNKEAIRQLAKAYCGTRFAQEIPLIQDKARHGSFSTKGQSIPLSSVPQLPTLQQSTSVSNFKKDNKMRDLDLPVLMIKASSPGMDNFVRERQESLTLEDKLRESRLGELYQSGLGVSGLPYKSMRNHSSSNYHLEDDSQLMHGGDPLMNESHLDQSYMVIVDNAFSQLDTLFQRIKTALKQVYDDCLEVLEESGIDTMLKHKLKQNVLNLEKRYNFAKIDMADIKATRSKSIDDISFFIEKMIEFVKESSDNTASSTNNATGN